jgi:hypothetical protein
MGDVVPGTPINEGILPCGAMQLLVEIGYCAVAAVQGFCEKKYVHGLIGNQLCTYLAKENDLDLHLRLDTEQIKNMP